MNNSVKRLRLSVGLFMLLILCCIFSLSYGGAAYANEVSETVYVGGIPIGISAYSKYPIVSEFVNVTSNDGSYSPAMKGGILRGDIILSVNGREVYDLEGFNSAVYEGEKESVEFKIQRFDETLYIYIKPVFDIVLKENKVGMMLKSDLSGIGTLTFVTNDNKYGALGHMITDSFGYGSIYSGGNIYKCNVVGYNRPTENVPGELRGWIDYESTSGTITENAFCGLYGEYTATKDDLTEVKLGSREKIKPGKAQILTTIDGFYPKLYDIEIIKTVKQNEPADKGLVFRVTDKSLKEKTGGILQGMSGSPIIQDGKLIGAVTHVFTMDPTKGYGIYIDWMLDKTRS